MISIVVTLIHFQFCDGVEISCGVLETHKHSNLEQDTTPMKGTVLIALHHVSDRTDVKGCDAWGPTMPYCCQTSELGSAKVYNVAVLSRFP